MKNLWPESFKESDFEAPKSIFEQQAKLLPKLTGDLVYAVVDELHQIYARREGIANPFAFSFSLRGNFLENYSFKVLSFSHDITAYPVLMNINSEIATEIGIQDVKNEIKSHEELEAILQKILNSNRVSEVIGAIIKMSK
ncbi:MAG: hypothetical protein WBC22_19535 [Sedimentisphaerales bacterium]